MKQSNVRLLGTYLVIIIIVSLFIFSCDSPSKRLQRERRERIARHAAVDISEAINTPDSAQFFIKKSWAIGRDVGGSNLLFMKDDVLYSVPLRKCNIVENINDTIMIGWNIKLPVTK